jgi:hypothetical protein
MVVHVPLRHDIRGKKQSAIGTEKMSGWTLVAAGPWTFRISDPSLIGWICFAGYFLAMAICAAAIGPVRLRAQESSASFWCSMAVLMALLGINKQLDLHSLFLEIGQDIVTGKGASGKTGSALLLLAFGSAGFGASLIALGYCRSRSKYVRTALGAYVFLIAVLIARNSTQGMSRILGWHLGTGEETLLHVHVSEVSELICLIAICSAAARSR